MKKADPNVYNDKSIRIYKEMEELKTQAINKLRSPGF